VIKRKRKDLKRKKKKKKKKEEEEEGDYKKGLSLRSIDMLSMDALEKF